MKAENKFFYIIKKNMIIIYQNQIILIYKYNDELLSYIFVPYHYL